MRGTFFVIRDTVPCFIFAFFFLGLLTGHQGGGQWVNPEKRKHRPNHEIDNIFWGSQNTPSLVQTQIGCFFKSLLKC